MLKSLLIIIACAVLVALHAEDQTSPAISLSPVYFRVEVTAGQSTTLTLMVQADRPATLLAAESDCRCVSVTTALPLAMIPGTPTLITVRIAGLSSGIERLTLRSTLGPMTAQIQVVTGSLGSGRDVLQTVIDSAVRQQAASLWFIVHDLKGHVRNCGCSHGSLGGIDHLAALPALCASIQPHLKYRFLLSGDSEVKEHHHRQGDSSRASSRDSSHDAGSDTHDDAGTLHQALRAYAWTRDDRAVVVSPHPETAITLPDAVVVISTRSSPIHHRRIVQPIVDSGMTALAVLIDTAGNIISTHDIPIDDTLPKEPAIIARFPDHLTYTIIPDAAPDRSCISCHSSAHSTWATSRHAHAWDSLQPADRTDSCIICHTTPLNAARERAPGVSCQACHQGSTDHAASAGTTRTTGTTDCRSCHTAQHHPAFHRDNAWGIIMHHSDPITTAPSPASK